MKKKCLICKTTHNNDEIDVITKIKILAEYLPNKIKFATISDIIDKICDENDTFEFTKLLGIFAEHFHNTSTKYKK